jgi:hypothetical protein
MVAFRHKWGVAMLSAEPRHVNGLLRRECRQLTAQSLPYSIALIALHATKRNPVTQRRNNQRSNVPEPDSIAYQVAQRFSQWTANPMTNNPGHLYMSAAESLLKDYDITPKEK